MVQCSMPEYRKIGYSPFSFTYVPWQVPPSGPLIVLNPYALDKRGGFTQSPFPARQTWRPTLCFLAFFHDVILDLQAHCVHTKACFTSLAR